MVITVFFLLPSEEASFGANGSDTGSADGNSGGAVDSGRDWIGHHPASEAEEAGNNHEDFKELHICHSETSWRSRLDERVYSKRSSQSCGKFGDAVEGGGVIVDR